MKINFLKQFQNIHNIIVEVRISDFNTLLNNDDKKFNEKLFF